MKHLKTLSPSAIDFEFQSLSLMDDYKQLKMVMSMLEYFLDEHDNFELVQAYLNLFLKVNEWSWLLMTDICVLVSWRNNYGK